MLAGQSSKSPADSSKYSPLKPPDVSAILQAVQQAKEQAESQSYQVSMKQVQDLRSSVGRHFSTCDDIIEQCLQHLRLVVWSLVIIGLTFIVAVKASDSTLRLRDQDRPYRVHCLLQAPPRPSARYGVPELGNSWACLPRRLLRVQVSSMGFVNNEHSSRSFFESLFNSTVQWSFTFD